MLTTKVTAGAALEDVLFEVRCVSPTPLFGREAALVYQLCQNRLASLAGNERCQY